MYFHHEGYHDAYYADSVLQELREYDLGGGELDYEPIAARAFLIWLAVVSALLCVAFTAITALN
jgi:hypothetical protein